MRASSVTQGYEVGYGTKKDNANTYTFAKNPRECDFSEENHIIFVRKQMEILFRTRSGQSTIWVYNNIPRI